MKAFCHTKYGSPDFLRLCEREKPIPQRNEVLVKVMATTVNRTDCAMLKADPFVWRFFMGLRHPKNSVLGTEFSGIVEAMGSEVGNFKIGDRVFGFNDQGLKSHAAYLVIDENKALATLPQTLTFDEAAAVCEGAHYAYNFINKIALKPGQTILINGASGGIGSAALQISKHLGAHVTAVCSSTSVALMKSLGADRIIEYAKTDFTLDTEKYDFVFDTVGKSSYGKCKPLLKPGGVYLCSELGAGMQNIFYSLLTPLSSKLPWNKGKKVKFPLPSDIKGSVLFVKKLLEQGKYKAIIDKKYPFEEIVEAFKYVDQGLKTGNVVISISQQL